MNLPEKVLDKTLTKQLSRHSSVKGQDRVATWVLDTQGFEQCNKGEITLENLFIGFFYMGNVIFFFF